MPISISSGGYFCVFCFGLEFFHYIILNRRNNKVAKLFCFNPKTDCFSNIFNAYVCHFKFAIWIIILTLRNQNVYNIGHARNCFKTFN